MGSSIILAFLAGAATLLLVVFFVAAALVGAAIECSCDHAEGERVNGDCECL